MTYLGKTLSPSAEEVKSSLPSFFPYTPGVRRYQAHERTTHGYVYRIPGGTIRAKDRRVYQTANIRRLMYQKVIYRQAVKFRSIQCVFFFYISTPILYMYFA